MLDNRADLINLASLKLLKITLSEHQGHHKFRIDHRLVLTRPFLGSICKILEKCQN